MICGLCDGIYDDYHIEERAAHAHYEPQSGPLRDAWMLTKLPWIEFERMIREHIAFIDRRRLDLHDEDLNGAKSDKPSS
jgi:hypothetical protein